MKFLIDTNILIPVEPTSIADLGVNTELAIQFINYCNSSGKKIFIHPDISYDIARDKNPVRRNLREKLLEKYPSLKSPPSSSILQQVGIPLVPVGTNDWVDNQLIAALSAGLVHYLVTEDIGIHKKAKRIGLDERVLLLSDAIAVLKDFFDTSPAPPPAVEEKYVYELSVKDPIFDSLKADYADFDNWLVKCRVDHRKAYVVNASSGDLAGIVILKQEGRLPDGTQGKVLKLCTFKVSEKHGGNRIGELLLKPVFKYAASNNYDYTYFTAFPKQNQLIAFANDFGFYEIENKESDTELALCKSLKYSTSDIVGMSPLEVNIRYGPGVTTFEGNRSFIVPIKPAYYLTLFPELGPRPGNLLSMPQKPCGNAIRKAYLCNAMIKIIQPGDNLFFYRSVDLSSIACIGIVEDTMRSQEPLEIAQFVGKRTVYSFSEIEAMCSNNEVLSITFRAVCPVEPRIGLRSLRDNGIVKAQPQSIMELKEPGLKWIRQQIKM